MTNQQKAELYAKVAKLEVLAAELRETGKSGDRRIDEVCRKLFLLDRDAHRRIRDTVTPLLNAICDAAAAEVDRVGAEMLTQLGTRV